MIDSPSPVELDLSRHEFARSLGLDDISIECFEAAIDDPLYAHYLVTARSTPEFLTKLLSNPPRRRTSKVKSDLSLALNVSKALVKWAKSGFSRVDDETYDRRLSACKACSYYTSASHKSTVYQLAISLGNRQPMICSLCGCIVSQKARISTEQCPAKKHDQPGVSRWGEPLSSSADIESQLIVTSHE